MACVLRHTSYLVPGSIIAFLTSVGVAYMIMPQIVVILQCACISHILYAHMYVVLHAECSNLRCACGLSVTAT